MDLSGFSMVMFRMSKGELLDGHEAHPSRGHLCLASFQKTITNPVMKDALLC